MITRTMVEKILEFAREPGINGYGKWGSLNVEQRKLVRELCKSWIIYDDATNRQTKEIERLKSIIKEVREYIEINLLKDDNGCGCWWYGFGDYNEAKYELLKILEKENK